MTNTFQVNQEVVRSKGDYVVGRTGLIVAIDTEKRRAQVQWYNDNKTWVSFDSLELTSIPYQIIPGKWVNRKGGNHVYGDRKWINPRYERL